MKFFRSMMMVTGAAFAVVACGETDVKVNRANVHIEEALSPGRTDSVTVTVAAEYPAEGLSDTVVSSMCDIIVETAFGSDYAGLEVQAAADKWAADFVDEYKKTNMELLADIANDSEDDGIGPILNWGTEIQGYFSGRHGDVISYTVTNYVYEGGAHGSASEDAVNMDIKSGKQISEDDFFIPGYKEGLSSALTAHLRDAMPDQESYDALFVKDIEPNGNFKVSEQGVTYIYGQYEIGPYYLGIIKVTVPWDELGDLVREHPFS